MIDLSNNLGIQWQNVEPPSGAQLKQISVGYDVVWALDTMGRLSVRRDVQSNVFPEGTHWQTLPAMPNDPIHIGISSSLLVCSLRSVCVIHIIL